MSDISTVMDGISGVLSRIAAIQAHLAPVPVKPAASSTFATALTQAQTSSSAVNPTGTVDGATYSAKSAGVTGNDVVSDASSYLGVPYVWAGNDRSGLDCSGLVQQTYKDLGISLPRIASDQQNVGTTVPSLSQAEPGDLLFFGQPAYHVAIYVGNNKMIEAPQTGEVVKIVNVSPAPSSIKRIVGVGSSSVPAATALPSGVAAYASLFATDTARYNLPTGLLAAVAHVESGGNPNAVSPAGAQGLMQLMPGTARSLGVNALDPTQAVDGAARMLSGLLAKYNGSVTLALAAYNAGSGAVDEYGGVPPYAETQAYVVKVQNAMAGGS
jgi:cell wall-associated NlpC family hydrolase